VSITQKMTHVNNYDVYSLFRVLLKKFLQSVFLLIWVDQRLAI
jgi:hypothetical protein